MPSGNEFSILADILDKQYQQDLVSNPFIIGAKNLPQTGTYSSEDSLWQAALQGLALGSAQGFMTRYGINQAEEEKRGYENAMLDYFRAGTPQDREAIVASNRLPAGLAGQMALADELDRYSGDRVSANAASLLGNDALAGEPMQIANLVRDKARLDKWGDVGFYEDKSAAGAKGRERGVQDFALDMGTNLPKATKAAEKARDAIAASPLGKNIPQLLSYADQIEKLATQDTPIADDAIITAYLKTIDPPSMARDSEVDRVMKARDYLSETIGFLNKKVAAGSGLSPEEKQNIINAINVVKESAQDKYWDTIRSTFRPMVSDGTITAFKSFDIPLVPPKYKEELAALQGVGDKAYQAIASGDRETFNVMRFEIDSMLENDAASLKSQSATGAMTKVKVGEGKYVNVPSSELAGKSRAEQIAVTRKYLGR